MHYSLWPRPEDLEEFRCDEENNEHAALVASPPVATMVEAKKTTLAPLSIALAPCDALPSPAVQRSTSVPSIVVSCDRGQ